MFSSQFAKVFLTYQTFITNLHLLRVELRWKLQEKLHCFDKAYSLYLSFRLRSAHLFQIRHFNRQSIELAFERSYV